MLSRFDFEAAQFNRPYYGRRRRMEIRASSLPFVFTVLLSLAWASVSARLRDAQRAVVGSPLAHLFTINHFKAGVLFFELDVAVKICAAFHRGQLWPAQLALPTRPFHPADLAVIAGHRDALLLSRDRD